MAELPRLNGVIGALEKGRHALTAFTPADAEALLRRNLFIYGVGGLIAPFAGIKLIDMLITAAHLA